VNRHTLYAVAAVFAIGMILRLDALTSSLWLDEFGTLWIVESDFLRMLERALAAYGQTPLYHTLPWLSLQVFGESELALRAPSLLLGCLSLAAVYSCARAIAGPTAGLCAVALFWLSIPGVERTVEARPYALVLLTVAVALTGFVHAVQSGTRRARVTWIVGGAAVAWTHYVHYPIVVGLYVAYTALPALRARYPIRRFAIDGLVQIALVLLGSAQVFTLIPRRVAISWIPHFNYAVLLEPIWPLLIGIGIGVAQLARRGDPSVPWALRTALLICLAFQITAIAAAGLAGVNLLSGRYLSSILIPAVVFVATTLVRARPVSVIAILVVFTVGSGFVFARAKELRGSFSGIGYQDWRTAVDHLRTRIGRDGNGLVLFRSGYVEEDFIPLGSPPQSDFAPLRSPGRPRFPVAAVPLNFRWAHPHRDEYFAQVIAPKVEQSAGFFAIGVKGDATVGNYMTKVAEWVESRWPGKYRVRRIDYGGVELLEFHPALSTQTPLADKAR
jgi:hypothetical protein